MAARNERLVDFPPQQVGKLAQARRVQDVDEKCAIVVFYFWLVSAELHKPLPILRGDIITMLLPLVMDLTSRAETPTR